MNMIFKPVLLATLILAGLLSCNDNPVAPATTTTTTIAPVTTTTTTTVASVTTTTTTTTTTIPICSEPVFYPAEGFYDYPLSLQITSDTSLSDAFYTLNGDIPTISSNKYTNPVIIQDNTTVKAFISKENYIQSGVKTAFYDILNSNNVGIHNKINTSNNSNSVCISGNKAYLTIGNGGVQVIDITDINNLTIIGTIDTPGYAQDVCVAGNYAFVADGTSGVQIIDITSIGISSVVKTVDTPGSASALVVNNNHLFVADGSSGLQIIDITNPLNASIVKFVVTSSVSRNFHAITQYNGYIFVSDWDSYYDNNSIRHDNPSFHVIDVNSPNNAFILSSVNMPSELNCIKALNNRLFTTSYSTPAVFIYNIENVQAPQKITQIDLLISHSQGFYVTEKRLYSLTTCFYDIPPNITPNSVLTIYNIENPFDVTIIKSVYLVPSGSLLSEDTITRRFGLVLDKNNIYIATGDKGLMILNDNY